MKSNIQKQSVQIDGSDGEKMSVKFEHISEMLDKCKNGYTDGLIHTIKCELDNIREVVKA